MDRLELLENAIVEANEAAAKLVPLARLEYEARHPSVRELGYPAHHQAAFEADCLGKSNWWAAEENAAYTPEARKARAEAPWAAELLAAQEKEAALRKRITNIYSTGSDWHSFTLRFDLDPLLGVTTRVHLESPADAAPAPRPVRIMNILVRVNDGPQHMLLALNIEELQTKHRVQLMRAARFATSVAALNHKVPSTPFGLGLDPTLAKLLVSRCSKDCEKKADASAERDLYLDLDL